MQAGNAATEGGQQRLLDVMTFNTWIRTRETRDEQLAAIYRRRFSPQYRVAFDAWLKTEPFTKPDAPPGPSFMPEYHNARLERSAELTKPAISKWT